MSKAPAQKPSAISRMIDGFELPAARGFASRQSVQFSGAMIMHKFITLLFVGLISAALCACSTLPTTFTTENLMKVHQGMSSKEILAMFGQPKNVDVSVCGRPPNQWTCTTWEYGEAPYDSARFRFSGKHNSLKLNDFDVDRDYNELAL